jgi:hypothetical protein
VIGLYEFLGKPTTYLIEQPGPLLNIDNVMCVLVCNYNTITACINSLNMIKTIIMTLEIRILGWNFHQDVADINRLIASQPYY